MCNAATNKNVRCRPAAIFAVVSLLVAAWAALEPCFADPIFTSEISARGQREHTVRVNRWGWYRIEAKSAEGVSLEIVDKLRGAFGRDGEAGEKDGRLTLFLEAGEYKIFTNGPDDARGNLTLDVTGFSYDGASDNDPAAGAPRSPAADYPYLDPFVQTSAELGRAEAKAWWIFVPRDTVVYINAMGRHLGALSVFRGGEWLAAHSADEKHGAVRGAPQKPLNGRRIVKRLERGKHLVVAYGGGKDRYTESDTASPLYVSWMLEPIGLPRQISGKINKSGINEYLVLPKDVNAVIESSDSLRITRSIIRHDSHSGKTSVAESGATDKLSPVPPALFAGQVRFSERGSGEQWLISINGKPGSDFKITPIDNSYSSGRYNYTPEESGEYRLFTLHTETTAGGAGDNIGASGVLVDLKDSSIVALSADTVSLGRRLKRKCNLFGDVTSYLWVDNAGTYTFAPGGNAEYEWRVKRFFVSPPKNYKEPRRKAGRAAITLEKGLHVIELYPSGAGTATFTIADKSADGKALENTGAAASRPSISFKPVNLKKERAYRFYLNQQLPDLSSIHIEKHPAPAEDRVAFITGADAEREELTTSRAAELKPGIPQYASLPKGGFRTYRFTVEEAGIYRIETTGRLHTALAISNRVGDILARWEGNGDGRNALVAEFFLPGSYMAVAGCRGESAGRMGIVFNRGGLVAGGQLQAGVDRRASIPAFGAAVYDFAAREDGVYRFTSFSPWNSVKTRLEGQDGWPLFISENSAGPEIELKKGAYKFYSLPRIHESERVTRVEQVRKRPKTSGFGPHAVNINEPVTALWVDESAGGADTDGNGANGGVNAGQNSRPARFLFEIPAPISANFSLTPDFIGAVKPQNRDTVLMKISGARKASLQKGKYEIAVTPVTPRNYAPYELSVMTEDLFAGMSYDAGADGEFRVRVGESGVYEIYSQGCSEVTARLYADWGKSAPPQQALSMAEIARDGGDPQNWNFAITEKLEPGTYRLRLSGGAGGQLPTRVFMRRMEDTLAQAIRVDAAGEARERKITLAGKLAVIPIEISSGDVLTVKANSASRAVCVLESSANKAVSTIGRRQGRKIKMYAPVNKGANYTLKIWLEGKVEDDVNIEVSAAEAVPLTLQKALGGVSGTAAGEKNNAVFYKIDGMDERGPGHYELITTLNDIDHATSAGGAAETFEREEESLLPGAGKQLWVKAVFKSPGKYHFVLNPVLITDIGEAAEKNRRKFETADKYRFSKNQIKYPEREELPVIVRPGREKVFEIDTPVQKFGLVTFAMDRGQPVAGLSAPGNSESADFVRGGIFVRGGQHIGERICVTAVIPGDTGRIIGWNARAAAENIGGSFTISNCALEKTDTLKTGRTVWGAEAASAKEYHIETGKGRVVTARLSPRAGILYISPGGRRDIYYGGENGARHTIEPDGGRMFLFARADKNAGGAGNIELEVHASPFIDLSDAHGKNELSAAGAGKAAGADSRGRAARNNEIARQFPVDTRETVRIGGDPSPARRWLFWSGSVESVDMISRSGLMTENLEKKATLGGAAIDGGGILLVSYAAGCGKITLCGGGDNANIFTLNECRWGEPVKKWGEAGQAISEMSMLRMAGGANWYSIDLPDSTHVSLHAPKTPAAVAIVPADGKVKEYEEFWDELSMDIPLAPGKYSIGIKPVPGSALAGAQVVVGFYPIPVLAEGSPLDMYVTSGQKRLARFDIKKRGKIGIGIQTDGETVEAALLDNNGFGIAKGRQIFTDLDRGTYYIALSIPPSESSAFAGAGVKLHLFGQTPPPKGPPAELINWITGGGSGRRP